ncbi:MAG: hypothetical protein KatS3mg004_2073 [Bryobacteraceae bacterium]|nr:MAG: hypothetical protein KatS3mg004_2073 [Bryobacteraceae bacterium]
MSSEWRPARARVFDLWLIPPGLPPALLEDFADAAGQGARISDSTTEDHAPEPGAAIPVVTGGAGIEASSEVSGWRAAILPLGDARPGVGIEEDGRLLPPQRLHPAERRRLERMPPQERAAARRLLGAARGALAQALGVPAAGVAAVADLSPLLEGAQSLRAGAWSVQRVPSPPGVYVFVAAPGARWGYRLAGWRLGRAAASAARFAQTGGEGGAAPEARPGGATLDFPGQLLER